MTPPVPTTTVVGSYPVPTWLRVFNTRESLRDAIMVVLKSQELAGIELMTDGELSRWDINHPETNGMIDYFIRPLAGVQLNLSKKQLEQFRQNNALAYRGKPAGVVVDALEAGTLNLAKDFEFVRPLTPSKLKFTVTSPYMLARVLINDYYADFEALVFALSEILAQQVQDLNADVIQVDEANLTGHPEDAELAAEAINRILRQVSGGKAVHLCFGNYGGQTIQKGTYEKLVDFINSLESDHVVLEMARRPASELEMLKELKPEMGIGLGVIDIKDNQVETPDLVAKRIEKAAKMVTLKRLKYVHPDCGFWMLSRGIADAKMRALVAGRNLFLGKQ